MDLALPRMDGWEATRRLKLDERTQHIPIVALTGHALAGHAEGARQAGCDAFVTKPCLPDALVAEIQRMLAAQADAGSGREAGAAGAGEELTARKRTESEHAERWPRRQQSRKPQVKTEAEADPHGRPGAEKRAARR